MSFISILLIFWAWFPKDESRLLAVLPLLLFLLPYAFICLRLYSQRFRSGLNLAISMSSALLVPGIMLVRFALTWDRRWWVLGNLILALLMQLVLIALAAKTYIHLPPLRHARLKLLVSMAYGFFLFVADYSSLVGFDRLKFGGDGRDPKVEIESRRVFA